jgi:N-acetylglucosaminyl-diphospho-decaprenol L-rhamnosyltransferase
MQAAPIKGGEAMFVAHDCGSITAIIVTYESGEVLSQCLDSLRGKTDAIIVIDNNSTDNSRQLAKDGGAEIIQLATNVGFGVANNLGAKQATTDWLLFINPDARIMDDAIEYLLNAALLYPQAGLFGPRIIDSDGKLFFQTRSLLSRCLHNPKGILHRPSGNCCTPFISGACMMVRRDLFLALGGFDPKIFLFFEDDDLCRRVSDVGKAIIYVDDAVVRHQRGQSTRSSLRNVFLTRAHMAWSRGYISHKYGIRFKYLKTIIVSGLKFALAALTFNKARMARHGGTWIGTWKAARKEDRPA